MILELEKIKDKESEPQNIDEKKNESSAGIIISELMVSGNTEDDAISSIVKSDVSSVCSGEWVTDEDFASLDSSSFVQQEATIATKEHAKNLPGPSSDGNDLN